MTAAKLSERKRRRLALLEASGWRCAYCSRALKLRTATVDHVVPKSRGGANVRANKVAACKQCNLSKGQKLLSEWTPPKPLEQRA